MFSYLTKSDVINVAITRAREYQFLFLSADIETFPENNLFGQYLKSLETNRKEIRRNELKDRFIKDISSILTPNDIKVLEGYPVAGHPLDIIASKNDKYLAIDLIGFPGDYEAPIHLERYKVFNRAGLQIFPLSYTEWELKRKQIVERILDILDPNHESSENSNIDEAVDFLTNRIQDLELSLIACNEDETVDLLQEILEMRRKFISTIKAKLYSESLTYNRYLTSFENVVQGILKNIEQIIILKQAMPLEYDLTEDEDEKSELSDLLTEQLQQLSELKDKSQHGISLLKKSTLLWSQTSTRKEEELDFDIVTSELEKLNKQVRSYSVR